MNTTPTIRNIDPRQIDADPDQPRKRFVQTELDELAASIASVGLLEPVIVRPVGDRFVLVAGERRWRAVCQLELATIAAIVRDVAGAEAFAISMIENVVRSDMNPIEEAHGYAKLLEAGLDVATIATRIGKAPASITARLALLKLAQPVADLVAVGQVDGFVAGHLARLTSEGQYRVVAAITRGTVTGPLEAARLCTAIAAQEAAVPAFDDWMTAPATMTTLAVMPIVDRRSEQLVAAIDRAAAALAEALELVDADVDGDLAGVAQITAAAAKLGKVASRRRIATIAKAG